MTDWIQVSRDVLATHGKEPDWNFKMEVIDWLINYLNGWR
jgi:hypothetical protein